MTNIRDSASAEELVVLINLGDTNADLIRQKVAKIERLKLLREKAYRQLEILKMHKKTIDTLKKVLLKMLKREINGMEFDNGRINLFNRNNRCRKIQIAIQKCFWNRRMDCPTA